MLHSQQLRGNGGLLLKPAHLCVRACAVSCVPQTVVKAAADERWTRRLVLDQRQLREGMVLRGNQARARRFVQVRWRILLPEAAEEG